MRQESGSVGLRYRSCLELPPYSDLPLLPFILTAFTMSYLRAGGYQIMAERRETQHQTSKSHNAGMTVAPVHTPIIEGDPKQTESKMTQPRLFALLILLVGVTLTMFTSLLFLASRH